MFYRTQIRPNKVMQSFISETINDILKTTTSFENVVFVLPTQRAKVFVKQEDPEAHSLTHVWP